jgi:hypothetical protein
MQYLFPLTPNNKSRLFRRDLLLLYRALFVLEDYVVAAAFDDADGRNQRELCIALEV